MINIINRDERCREWMRLGAVDKTEDERGDERVGLCSLVFHLFFRKEGPV